MTAPNIPGLTSLDRLGTPSRRVLEPGTATLDGLAAWPRHCGTSSFCFR